ncbi:MAG: serine/threonine protein kinase [Sandaracinus sp.]|nr:serine/threonine protein kinase [Myxococcales bacterium]MCB9612158.1 serine/threonine protein kinase [Sandaracinus sp.]
MRVCPQCAREYLDGEGFCPFDGARLREGARAMATVPPSDPYLGMTLDGRYYVERVLGRGGMGTVYAARLVALNKPVALKLLRPVQDDGGQAVGRFEREARAASRLGNPHIVDIFDFGRSQNGLSFLAMELLDGEDLGNLLARERRVPLERALRIVLQCCTALGAAHAAGIIHRDLKPENVFLVTRGHEPEFVKIVDFGLAKISETEQDGAPGRKLTRTGMIFGTPQYMSPEQGMGRPTDHRSDVYALGLILYELLTGKVPFDGETFMSVIQQHLSDPPPTLRAMEPAVDVPPSVEAVVYRCLDKRAGARPQSMGELAEELLAALRAAGQEAMAQRLQRFVVPMAEPTAAMALTKRKPASMAPPPMAPAPTVDELGETLAAQPVVDVEALQRAKLAEDARRAEAARVPTPSPSPRVPTPSPSPHQPPRQRNATPTARAPRLLVDDEPIPPPPSSNAGRLILLGLMLLALGGLLGFLALRFAP